MAVTVAVIVAAAVGCAVGCRGGSGAVSEEEDFFWQVFFVRECNHT